MNLSSFQYALQKLYWDLNSFFWDDYLIKTGMNDEFELLSEYLKQKLAKPGAGILDIGSATGALSITLVQKGFKVTGIDFSPLMIRKAKRKIAGKSNLIPSFINLDINQILPFNDDEFDLVICRHSFNAALDKEAFVKKIKRIEKNNGLIFLAGKYFNKGKEKNYNKGFFLRLIHLIKPVVFRNHSDNSTQLEIIGLFEQNNFKLLDEKLSDYNYSLLFSLHK